MPIFFNANYRGIAIFGKNQGTGKTIMNAAAKYANFRVAMFWHRMILPRHFEAGAKRKYRHKKRKRKYSAIKRLLAAKGEYTNPATGKTETASVVKGGVIDIAFEGATERKSRATRAIRATRDGFVLKMRVPRYLLGRKRGDYPNMKRELSTITTQEAMLLGRVWWREAQRFLLNNKVTQ